MTTYGLYNESNNIFSDEELLQYGIESIQTISEATFTPRIMVRFRDGKRISLGFSRELMHDLNAWGIKADFKDILIREIERELQYQYQRHCEGNRKELPKKETKRVYSDLDPYGEENWED
jgi:hypothetical protein